MEPFYFVIGFPVPSKNCSLVLQIPFQELFFDPKNPYTLRRVEGSTRGLSSWWFQICFLSPLLGKMIKFDEHIFQMGWNHQLVICLERSLIFSFMDCHGYSFYVSCLHWWTNTSIFFIIFLVSRAAYFSVFFPVIFQSSSSKSGT